MSQGFQLQGQGPAAYERYLVPAQFAPCASQLLGTVAGADLNQGMLDVAGQVAVDLPVRIDWRRAEAASLPSPDGAFEVVCCQQGLQFFADRLRALREARRVLAPGGRVALAVWRAIHHNPVYAAFAQVLRRHAGAETAALMQALFAGPDRDGLGRLLTDTGFGDVQVRIGIFAVRFASPRELLRAQAASSPLGAPLAALDEEVREALAGDLDRSLGEWADDHGIAFPAQTWLVTAHR